MVDCSHLHALPPELLASVLHFGDIQGALRMGQTARGMQVLGTPAAYDCQGLRWWGQFFSWWWLSR